MKPLHLYVHVPFCAHRCPYCHFYNIGHDDGRETVFVDAASREIARWESAGAFRGGSLETLYWGGGTPSTLSEEGFDRLASDCLDVGPLSGDLEWTIEMNPGDVTAARLDRYLDRGVTRLSIGVQSFADERLAFLDRRHTGRDAIDAVETASRAGFDNVSIDLMFNLATGEESSAWARDLDVAFALPISHVSLYGLTVEPGTAFSTRASVGERLTRPAAEYAVAYGTACAAALAAGFEHYEVSSFARPGYRARHNAAYWRGAPYLGVGPSAHSFDGRRRWANLRSLVGWSEAVTTGGDPRAFVETIDGPARSLETLYLELRTVEGVRADHPLLQSDAGRELSTALKREGLLTDRRDRVACTESGFVVFDAILDRFAAGVD